MIESTETFTSGLSTLMDSGVGVAFIRTREPNRTIDVLREHGIVRSTNLSVWDFVYGWQHFDKSKPMEGGQIEKAPDPYGALKSIMDIDGGGKKPRDSGYFAATYIHPVIKQHPGVIQLLKHYVRMFTEIDHRLFLLVPEGYSPPQELQNDIPILDFPLPSVEELYDSLVDVIECTIDDGNPTDIYTVNELNALARNASGMTKLEAENAFSEATVVNRETWPGTPFEDFNQVVLRCKTDVVKRSEVLELLEAETFSSVGGLELFKEYVSIRNNIFSEEARSFGVDTPKGIMLIGPPGTGKSLCGKAVASSLNLPLIKFDVGKVFDGLVGSSEARVRSALTQLVAMAPCVVLMDEIDKGLGGVNQGGGDSGVSKRVLGTILTFMQENKSPVYWIFTANRIDGLPPELVRKGRLDDVFSVTLPNESERKEIIKIHLAKRNQNPSKVSGLSKAVKGSSGYVSAEIEAAVKESVIESFNTGEPITGDMLVRHLDAMCPMSVAFKEDMDSMSEWAKKNARPTSFTDGADVKAVSVPKRRRKVVTGGER